MRVESGPSKKDIQHADDAKNKESQEMLPTRTLELRWQAIFCRHRLIDFEILVFFLLLGHPPIVARTVENVAAIAAQISIAFLYMDYARMTWLFSRRSINSRSSNLKPLLDGVHYTTRLKQGQKLAERQRVVKHGVLPKRAAPTLRARFCSLG